MARPFAKVSEEEIVVIIEAAFLYPSDLVNTKTTIPLRVGEERWIYSSTLRVSLYIHHYSPPLRGIVIYYSLVHHHSVSVFTKYQRQLNLSGRFSTVPGLFELPATMITTKEIEIQP